MNKIRVLVADEHTVVRAGLVRLLEQQQNITVIGEVSSGEQACKSVASLKPDIVVINIILADMSGLDVLQSILKHSNKTKVLMFSMEENISFASHVLSHGAAGYLALSELDNNLVSAVETITMGNIFISEHIAQKVAQQNTPGNENKVEKLSGREFEIFKLIVIGETMESIAKQLNISQKTVANYQTILKQKLGVSSPIEWVRLAMKYGVIQP